MDTGFAKLPLDHEFARRSAQYLADQGYGPAQIRAALVEQLNVTDSVAQDISAIAA